MHPCAPRIPALIGLCAYYNLSKTLFDITSITLTKGTSPHPLMISFSNACAVLQAITTKSTFAFEERLKSKKRHFCFSVKWKIDVKSNQLYSSAFSRPVGFFLAIYIFIKIHKVRLLVARRGLLSNGF